MRMVTTLATGLCALILWNCSSSVSQVQTQQKNKPPRSAPLQTFEKDFKPSKYDPEIKSVETTAQKIKLPNDNADTSVLQETVQGYRVQILVTNDITEANESKGDIAYLFQNDIVYVMYQAPYYKVRLGDYKSRAEAAQALKILSEKGYTKAWIIPDRVLRYPPKPAPHHTTVQTDSTKEKK